MKKSEILRRRVLFRRIAQTGKRLDGQLLRCAYLVLEQSEVPLQIAIRVPSGKLNAVRRNRLKRLMREAFSAERALLDVSLTRAGVRIGIMLSYKGAKDLPVVKVTLSQIRSDVGKFCTALASRL